MKRYICNTLIGLGTLAALAVVNEAARTWYLHWGATKAEINRSWPGDELMPGHTANVTRAITINAPAEQVWPWIVQIGQDRGGFYSYTWLENLVLVDMHNADRIVPEYQTREVGDTVWMAPKRRFGGNARMMVVRVVPNRAMVLVMPPDFTAAMRGERPRQGVWQFLLDPVDANSTRLIMRGSGADGFSLFAREIFDPIHFIMERGMMLGIKKRAENGRRRVAERTQNLRDERDQAPLHSS